MKLRNMNLVYNSWLARSCTGLCHFFFFLLHLEAGAGAKCSLFFTLLLQYITYLQPLQYNIKFI